MLESWTWVQVSLFNIGVGVGDLLHTEFFPGNFLLRKEMHFILMFLYTPDSLHPRFHLGDYGSVNGPWTQ